MNKKPATLTARGRKTVLFLLMILIAPSGLFAAGLTIGNITQENGKRYLRLSAHSYQGTEIMEAVKRGIEAKVFFQMQIIENRALNIIYNKVVYDKTYNRSLRFDFWSRSYVVSERGKKSQYNSITETLNNFFTLEKIEIPDHKIHRGSSYRIRARARLVSVELYFPLNYIFQYVVGYWDFDTGWIGGGAIAPQ